MGLKQKRPNTKNQTGKAKILRKSKKKNLNFGIVGGDENFSLAIAIEISDDRRRQTFALELNWVLIREVHPGLSEGKITLMLKISKNPEKGETILDQKKKAIVPFELPKIGF